MGRIPAFCALILATALLTSGCFRTRLFAVSDVADLGPQIRTQNRYNVFYGATRQECLKSMVKGKVRGSFSSNEKFYRFQPQPFSTNGIPVCVIRTNVRESRDDSGVFAALAWLLTLGAWPCPAQTQESTCSYSIQILGMEWPPQPFRLYSRREQMISMLPLGFLPALLCYRGNPTPDDMQGARQFENLLTDLRIFDDTQEKAALVYAIAVK